MSRGSACVWKSGWGKRHRSPPGHFNDTSRRCCLPFLVPSVLIIFRSAVTVTGFCYLLQSQNNSVYITLDYKFAERIFLPFILQCFNLLDDTLSLDFLWPCEIIEGSWHLIGGLGGGGNRQIKFASKYHSQRGTGWFFQCQSSNR